MDIEDLIREFSEESLMELLSGLAEMNAAINKTAVEIQSLKQVSYCPLIAGRVDQIEAFRRNTLI